MMNEINNLPHVRAGKLTLLNINHGQRHPDFPDVPTLTEAGYPDSDVPIWFAIFAPAGTNKDIVQKLNAKIVELAKADDTKAKMLAISIVVPTQTPDEMVRFAAEDTGRNAEIIKAANVKLD
jgi:tripartite-type tricarboxylate transporter receptor subunit TctC